MPSVGRVPAEAVELGDRLGAVMGLRMGDTRHQTVEIEIEDPDNPGTAKVVDVTGWTATLEIEYYEADVSVDESGATLSGYEPLKKSPLSLPVTVQDGPGGELAWDITEAVTDGLDVDIAAESRLPVAVAYLRRQVHGQERTILILQYVVRRSAW